MLTSDQVLAIATILQPRLSELLPTDRADIVQQKLTDLITQFNQGEDTSQEILDLLDEQPELEAEITIVSKNLKQSAGKQYDSLAGNSPPTSSTLHYKCPDCGKSLKSPQLGIIPKCPNHPNAKAISTTG